MTAVRGEDARKGADRQWRHKEKDTGRQRNRKGRCSKGSKHTHTQGKAVTQNNECSCKVIQHEHSCANTHLRGHGRALVVGELGQPGHLVEESRRARRCKANRSVSCRFCMQMEQEQQKQEQELEQRQQQQQHQHRHQHNEGTNAAAAAAATAAAGTGT